MSKDLFLMMQEQEIQTSNFLPTKKELVKSTTNFITEILDSGNHNIHELLSQSKRLSEALNVIDSEIIKRLPGENFEAFGLKGTFVVGDNKLNYSEDYLVAELEEKIKQRKLLVETATKSNEPIYDSQGIEVSKVGTTPIKSSIRISF